MLNQFVGVSICTFRMLIIFFKHAKELMTVVPDIYGYICYHMMIAKEPDITWEIHHTCTCTQRVFENAI